MTLTIIHALAAALGIGGALLLAARRPRAALAVWLPADALWVAWAVGVRDPWTGAQFVVFFVMTSVGLWNWTRRKEKTE